MWPLLIPTSRPRPAMVSRSRPSAAMVAIAAASTCSRGWLSRRRGRRAGAGPGPGTRGTSGDGGIWRGSDLRLLLGDAVDTATRCEDRTCVHQGHGPAREEPAEDGGRFLVTRVVEGAQHDAVVALQVGDVGVVD